jgi:iron complex outermembrane receptor protein
MEVMGLEAELAYQPMDRLLVRSVLGWQDGEYNDYTTPIPAGYDLTDADIDRAPEWQYTLDGTYTFCLGDGFDLALNANVMYTDENLFTQSIATPDDNTYLDARTLVNANLTLLPSDERYFVRLIGRNLTDQTYKSASQVVGGLWAFTIYGPPRYFGIEAGMKFGK